MAQPCTQTRCDGEYRVTLPDLTDQNLLTRTGVTRPAYVPGEPAWNQVWWLAAHPDDRERIQAERQQGLVHGIAFEMEARLRFKTGQYRWQLVQYNPLKDEGGQIIRWYVTATDIDDRKRDGRTTSKRKHRSAGGNRSHLDV